MLLHKPKMLKQKILSVCLESLWILLHLGVFISGYGFNICIAPKYHIERIKWLAVGSLNDNRVSVDFLTSHILEKVANCMIGYFASASFPYLHGDKS